MILSTGGSVPGREIVEVLGLAKGNTIRARNVGRDILAGLRHIVGGEIGEYTKLMAESREQAIDRMMENARGMGADAVVGIRIGRIGEVGLDLRRVPEPVTVRVTIVGIGTGIGLVNVDAGTGLHPIRQTVAVRINILISTDVIVRAITSRLIRTIKRSRISFEILK